MYKIIQLNKSQNILKLVTYVWSMQIIICKIVEMLQTLFNTNIDFKLVDFLLKKNSQMFYT